MRFLGNHIKELVSYETWYLPLDSNPSKLKQAEGWLIQQYIFYLMQPQLSFSSITMLHKGNPTLAVGC